MVAVARPVVGHDLWALAERAERDGGFTYRLADARFPAAGFAVSPDKGPERVLRHAPTAEDLLGFLSDNWDVIQAAQVVFRGGVCLGAWKCGPDRWCLDISIVVSTLDEALTLGRANAQLAVYDLAAGESIAVPYHAPLDIQAAVVTEEACDA